MCWFMIVIVFFNEYKYKTQVWRWCVFVFVSHVVRCFVEWYMRPLSAICLIWNYFFILIYLIAGPSTLTLLSAIWLVVLALWYKDIFVGVISVGVDNNFYSSSDWWSRLHLFLLEMQGSLCLVLSCCSSLLCGFLRYWA